jgi:glucose-1-phosphate adenylyltransferase
MSAAALEDILAVIMGGGRGARLYPLTKLRAKPAVPIAGKYRLIDVPISNCINSGIYRIAVLTQFHSVSLNRHITRTYRFDNFHTDWGVQILAAEQTLQSEDWYQGTADAVRKQIREIIASDASYVLILAGDHLYRMDYSAMAHYHWDKNADITVAVQPVSAHEASRLGILKSSDEGRITAFVEKPKDPKVQAQFISRDDPERPFLGSMGIYMFKTEVLIDLLTNAPDHDDFGGDVIPNSIRTHAVYGYNFDGYWRDIGTIRSFYETNLELAQSDAPFNFFDLERPIYTYPRILAATSVHDSTLKDVQLSEGCIIARSKITNSIIGIRTQVGPGTRIKDSVLMGADYYSNPSMRSTDVPIGVGPNCVIEGAILDKNVRIGEGVVIKPFPRGTEIDAGTWVVQDGIVVIPKDTTILPNTHIEPE